MSDLSIKEVASFMGISAGNAKVKLHRARKQLGERLEKMLKKHLEMEKLNSGFIFTVMSSIKSLPIPSISKPNPIRWLPISISIGMGLLIGLIGFGISFDSGISSDILSFEALKAVPSFEVSILSRADKQEFLRMKGDRKNKAFAPQNIDPLQRFITEQSAETYTILNSEGIAAKSEAGQMITIDLPAQPEDAKRLEMVLINRGSFIMGSAKAERGRSEDDWPLHKVTISKAFYMGSTK
jgi:hypothetical protein